LNGRFHAWLH